jgi:hypothetical protein
MVVVFLFGINEFTFSVICIAQISIIDIILKLLNVTKEFNSDQIVG